jgi:hypothetical protein
MRYFSSPANRQHEECLYALEHQAELVGLICESFAYEIPAPSFVLAVFKGMGHLAPHAHILHLPNERSLAIRKRWKSLTKIR